MPARRRVRHDAWSTALQSTELAWAAPQVVAHRVGRFATAGPLYSARDTAEFTRMWSEKVVAFQQSWMAMAFAAQKATLASFAGAWGRPSASAFTRANDAAWSIYAAGLRPVHRTAVANARRLGRSTGR